MTGHRKLSALFHVAAFVALLIAFLQKSERLFLVTAIAMLAVALTDVAWVSGRMLQKIRARN